MYALTTEHTHSHYRAELPAFLSTLLWFASIRVHYCYFHCYIIHFVCLLLFEGLILFVVFMCMYVYVVSRLLCSLNNKVGVVYRQHL